VRLRAGHEWRVRAPIGHVRRAARRPLPDRVRAAIRRQGRVRGRLVPPVRAEPMIDQPDRIAPAPLEPDVGPRSVINRVVAGSLSQRFLVTLLAALLIGAGVWSFRRLPVDAYPDLSPTMVEIITQWPGHASEEVERLITVPIEIEMNGLPKLRIVRSISLYGLSDVRLTFEDNTDDYFARQQAFERFSDLSLPDGVTPGLAPLTSPSGLVYRYVLESNDRSAMELKNINDWVITKAYKSVSGVADDSPLGGETMQYQVLLDPTRLAGAGLTVPDVQQALANNN